MNNQITIIGGMGPQASAHLHKRVLDLSRQFHDGAPDSYPSIQHFSLQIPDFIKSDENVDNAIEKINKACASMDFENTCVIGIACNTAHLLLKDLHIPKDKLISIIDSVEGELDALGKTKIGVLASPFTLRSQMFQNLIVRQGKTPITPSLEDIKHLDRIIHRVIQNEDPTLFVSALSKIVKKLEKNGAEVIVLGCTELPIVGVISDLPVVSSTDALARAMLQKLSK